MGNLQLLMVNEIDKELVKEITLFIENDGDLYRGRIQPFINNFRKKIQKRKFDKGLAVKGLSNNVVPEEIKKYNKEFGSNLRTTSKEKNKISRNILRGMGDEVCDSLKNKGKCLKKFN